MTDRCRFETRYHITSAPLAPAAAAQAIRGHWGIATSMPPSAPKFVNLDPEP